MKEAAKREVGTGPGQIPDLSAFTSGPGWVRFPNGTIIQRGSAGFNTGVNNQYVTLPRAFSSANFRVATVWNDVGVSQGGATAQAAADDETATLAGLKKYRVLLMRVDTTKPVWPSLPGEQAS